MDNTLGNLFRITSFGESHGRCVGVVIDGCPAGLPLAENDIQTEVDRRRPGTTTGSTPRSEEDRVEVLSGIFEGRTTGAPIAMLVWNKDIDSSGYETDRFLPRPGHADYTAFVKYGGFSDFRGGGRFSGRITAGFVMAGAVARKVLALKNIEIAAHAIEIGGIKAGLVAFDDIKARVYTDLVRCADPQASAKMVELIQRMAAQGDSVGGIVEGIARNVPTGLGGPVFDTLEGDIAKSILSIPAVKGVEFGAGFAVAAKKGSENNDPFRVEGGRIITTTNNCGGILGGISDAMPIVVRVAVKPTPSIAKTQNTVDLAGMENAIIAVRGRHDACIVPRAVPVVEAMMTVTICDFALRAGIIPGVIK